MRSVLTISLLSIFAAMTPAEVTAIARLTPPSVPIYRTAEYSVIIEGPKGLTVPKLKLIEQLQEFDIGTGSPENEPLEGDRERLVLRYTLDAKAAGEYTIPKATLDLGNGQQVQIPALALTVREPSEAELKQVAQFVDIGDPALIAPPRRSVALYVGLAMVLLVALSVTYYYWQKRMAKEVWSPPALKPWQVANKRLEELASRRLPHQGRYETFYVDLTAILRYYIEDRFQLHAPERTTPEFLDEAARSGALVAEQQQTLEQFLRHCDRVKFARYEPSFEEMEKSYAVVERFVIDTTPSPASPEVAKEAA